MISSVRQQLDSVAAEPVSSALRRAAWVAVILGPLLLLWALTSGAVSDPQWMSAQGHFSIVSLTSLTALLLAGFMAWSARQIRDPSVLFLSLGMLGLAGVFFVHAVTTPGVVIEDRNPWVGVSTGLSIFLASIGIVLSSVAWPADARRRIVQRQGWMAGAFCALLIGYAALALGTSVTGRADAFSFLVNPALDWTIFGLTLSLLGIAVIRYALRYRRRPQPLLTGMLVAAIFLYQSELSLAFAPTWAMSWWESHVLMLAAFAAIFIGMLLQYGRSGNAASVVEGLLLRDAIAQVQQRYTEVIVALIAAVEARDPYTRGHTERVAELALRMGEHLNLDQEHLVFVHQAALLHDIGKIGIPDAILNKPGPLTIAEMEIVREHPVRGEEIIQAVPSLRAFASGIRHHHERLDGSGYPDGLHGRQIALEARIIAVADMYDALTSARPYRGPWPTWRALALIDRESGVKLDPLCVAALHAVIGVPSPLAEYEPALVAHAN